MDVDKTILSVYQKMVAALPLPLADKEEDIVPGEGTDKAVILFIGEAPGYHETVQRKPFVGRSGQLLRKTITQVGLKPEEYYISNIVKARPPDNRDPSPQEIAQYKPFLDEEIKILEPKIIITLGRFSMQKFLPDAKISQVHGRLHSITWNGRKTYVLPMYHPAAALRSTAVTTAFISDFQKIEKVLAWIDSKQEDDTLQSTVKEALL